MDAGVHERDLRHEQRQVHSVGGGPSAVQRVQRPAGLAASGLPEERSLHRGVPVRPGGLGGGGHAGGF